jgi:DNA-directed RNA polymerase specialized sigma24 family protein
MSDFKNSEDPAEDEKKLLNEPDFVLVKRFDYSLKRMIERKPDGLSNKAIGQALGIPEEEVEEKLAEILKKLKSLVRNI